LVPEAWVLAPVVLVLAPVVLVLAQAASASVLAVWVPEVLAVPVVLALVALLQELVTQALTLSVPEVQCKQVQNGSAPNEQVQSVRALILSAQNVRVLISMALTSMELVKSTTIVCIG
jgi:hypothetical protein